jgi:hypothetical protein
MEKEIYSVKKRKTIILFPARESLVSDIPAWDGKIVSLFTLYGTDMDTDSHTELG